MKSVVFDIGNVLIDWGPSRLFRHVFSSDAEIEILSPKSASMTGTSHWTVAEVGPMRLQT